MHWLTGSDLTEEAWDAFFEFYMETGSRKWGRPYLTRKFYSLIGERMADKVVLIMAKRAGRFIAGAINFIGSDTLYGRHWGAVEHHPFLHFELCYYQAIDFAIERKLKRVEAGAQGEHKLARGYMPVTTHSAHFIADPGCGGRSPTIWCASAPMWKRPAKSLRRRRRSARIWSSRSSMIQVRFSGSAMAEATIRTTFSRKSCAANCPATRSTRTTRCWPSSTSCRARPATRWCCRRRRRATCSTSRRTTSPHVARAAQKIAKAAMTVFGADGITVQQFNESAGGQVVFHLHVHVIPRKAGVPMKPPASEKEKPEVLSDQALKLAAALKGA